MCGKCAANFVYSAARMRRIFAKCAAYVRQIFVNYVGFLCWKGAQAGGKFDNYFYKNERVIILSL